MNKEDLKQIKETINFALINSKFKDEQGFVFNKKAQTSLSKIEEQLTIHSVVDSLCQCNPDEKNWTERRLNECCDCFKPLSKD